MGKNHLKRINMPKTWHIKRKGIRFITRPKPGQASMKLGMPISIIMKDILGLAKTTREAKSILNGQEVLVDNKRRKEHRYIIGFMDALSFPKIGKHYRIILTKQGTLIPKEITEKESKIKICKIKGKTMTSGKIQLNLSDGRNVIVNEKGYNIGDSLVYDLATNKIKETIKFEKDTKIALIGGKHIGQKGTLLDVKGPIISYKDENGEVVETLKKYAYCIGKDKEIITTNE